MHVLGRKRVVIDLQGGVYVFKEEGEPMVSVMPQMVDDNQEWQGWQDDSGIHARPQLQDSHGAYCMLACGPKHVWLCH